MLTHRHLFALIMCLPIMAGCAYFDAAENAPEPVVRPAQVEVVDHIVDHTQVQQDVRDIIANSTDGAVQIFSLDKQVGGASSLPAQPFISTLETAGLGADNAKTIAPVDAAPISSPGHSGGSYVARPNVEVFPFEDQDRASIIAPMPSMDEEPYSHAGAPDPADFK